ncbi:U4/U6-U5 snRNP complex subunit lsm6 [Hypoxylon texense]
MGDPPPPSPAKRKLPFKRTVRRKSSEVADDDGLSLFKRSGAFFEEQQRLAKEKAEKEKAEKAAKEARAAREEQERKIRKERLAQERQAKKEARNKEPAKKRRRTSTPDDEKDDNDSDEDIFNLKPAKRQKSPSAPHTPSSRRESSFANSTRGSGGRLTRSQSRKTGTPVISLELDDDDDDDPFGLISPTKRPKTRNVPESSLTSPTGKTGQDIIALDDDSDAQSDIVETRKEENKEEDPSEYYVRIAMERARKAKEEREARENGAGGVEEDPVVQILIHPQLDGVHPLMFRRKLSQQLTVVYKTWVEQQVVKHSPVPRPILETMFFTWKGNKVYPHTSLRTLGIRPDQDGNLYPSWKKEQEGYQMRDRVLFEAWTQELYDDYLKEKERQRLRDLGELLDDEEPEEEQESEQADNSQEDKKIRVQFKAKNAPVKNATVRSSTTAAQLVKVYRRLADISEDMTIELRWDGEVLEPDMTVEEADIEDMDSIEVHVK